MPQNKAISISLGQGISLSIGLTTTQTWKNSTRPKKPKAGIIGFNTETISLEYWSGTQWYSAKMSEIQP